MSNHTAQARRRDLETIRVLLNGNDFDTLQQRVTAYGQALRAGVETAELSAEDCRQLRQVQAELETIMHRRRDEAIAWLSRNRRIRKAIGAYASPSNRGFWRAP